MIMNQIEDKRCEQVAELFKPFLEELGDACVVRSEQFGYIVLTYWRQGKFEDNNIFCNAEDLFQFLMEHWKFHWIYRKAKKNGTEEFEDFERELTEEQREERERIVVGYERAYRKIMI